MCRHLRLQTLLLILLSISSPSLYAKEVFSSLIQKAERLHCSSSEFEAAAVLKEIEGLTLSSHGLPVDHKNEDGDWRLYVASVDILLRALDDAASQYSNLEQPVLDVVGTWQLCDLFESGQYLDLKLIDDDLVRTKPNEQFPAGKVGLLRWGLLNKVPNSFRSPFAGSSTELSKPLHDYTKQCFPHPLSGEFEEQTFITAYGSMKLATLNASKPEGRYPFKWRPACEVALGELDGYNEGYEAGIITGLGRQNKELAKKGKRKDISQSKRQEIMHRAWSEEAYEAGINKQRDIGFKSGFALGTRTKAALALSEVIPISGSVPIIDAKPKRRGHGFSGSYYHSLALKNGKPSIGGRVSWAPKKHWFIRAGMNYKYTESGSQKVSYSWGGGYDNWRPGSFGLQINNWGPIQFGEGLNIKKAVLAATYKANNKWLQSKKIGAALALTTQLGNAKPALQTNFRWSPFKTWYAYSGLSIPLNGDNPTWSYGFGRQDYRPFTLTIQYNNYGPNTLFRDNFEENGTLTIGGSWAY